MSNKATTKTESTKNKEEKCDEKYDEKCCKKEEKCQNKKAHKNSEEKSQDSKGDKKSAGKDKKSPKSKNDGSEDDTHSEVHTDRTGESAKIKNPVKESNTKLTKPEKISMVTAITKEVPMKNIVLTQLPDGFSLAVEHSNQSKSQSSWYESNYSYYKEEHFGRDVEKIRGKFNKGGNYEVIVDFPQ